MLRIDLVTTTPHAVVFAAVLAVALGCPGGTEVTSSPSGTTSDSATTTSFEPTTSTSTGLSSGESTSSSSGEDTETDGNVLPPDVTILASGFPRSQPLWLIDDDVVWASFGEENGGTGKILRVPQAGGEVEVVQDGLDLPTDIASSGTWIYWADSMAGVVGKVDIDGGEASVAADFPGVIKIALDSTYIYGISAGGSGNLARVPISGGPLEELLTDLDNASSILVHEDSLIWIESGTTLEVRTMLKAGGDVTSLSMGIGPSRELVASDTYIYWLSAGPGGGVLRAPLSGGIANTIVSPEIPAVLGLARSDEHIFWTNAEEHSLSYADLDGVGVAVLVDEVERPEEIVLSQTHAFFTDFYAGRVLRVGLP